MFPGTGGALEPAGACRSQGEGGTVRASARPLPLHRLTSTSQRLEMEAAAAGSHKPHCFFFLNSFLLSKVLTTNFLSAKYSDVINPQQTDK